MSNSVRPKTDRRKTPRSAPETAAGATILISQSDIARRAFELYCARGRQDGDALGDWLRAERELMNPRVETRKKAAPKQARPS